MDRAIKVEPEWRGRPAAGKAPLIGVRMPAELTDRIEASVAGAGDSDGRSESIRRPVATGLATEKRDGR
jgi:hypothetical protein